MAVDSRVGPRGEAVLLNPHGTPPTRALRRRRRAPALHPRRRVAADLAVGALGVDPGARDRARHHAVHPQHPARAADSRREPRCSRNRSAPSPAHPPPAMRCWPCGACCAAALRIGTEQCLGGVHLPRELADFRRSHPAVSVRLGFAGSTTLLDAGGRPGCSISRSSPTAERCPRPSNCCRIASEGFVVLCHPDHPLAGPGPRRDRRSRRRDVRRIRGRVGRPGARRPRVRRGGARALGRARGRDVGSLLDLVGYGLGVAVVPAHFAEKRPELLSACRSRTLLVWRTIAVPERPTAAAAALVGRCGSRPRPAEPQLERRVGGCSRETPRH